MRKLKLLKFTAIASAALLIVSLVTLSGLYLFLAPQLPSIEGLSDVRLQVPLRIYSSDGSLLGEFGEKRRTPKSLDEIPVIMQQAFLAAEDDRFFEHPGVDYQGILRAVLNLIVTGERGQGGSTITMQLARNFYLSREKTYIRKISEIFLALKMESELSKQRILELYLNKIYLGNRSYGVAAASRVYYGKELEDLSLFQIAMIAGLPKAPARYNPIIDPQRAVKRRNYVLTRMHKLGHIDDEVLEMGMQEPATAKKYTSDVQVDAPYVNEMVRREIVKQFGDGAYTSGLNVYTTISDKLQVAVNDSLWKGLISYDQRHGYRGVIKNIELEATPDGGWVPAEQAEVAQVVDESEEQPELISLEEDSIFEEEPEETNEDKLRKVLENEDSYGRLKPALVLSVSDEPDAVTKKAEVLAKKKKLKFEQSNGHAVVMLKGGERVVLPWSGMSWARAYKTVNLVGDQPKLATEVLQTGDVIWVYKNENESWVLAQLPDVQGAFVALEPNDGAIKGLAGGFNFRLSNFNRATQASRQAGSGFKPIIYSAALSKSFTPASLINDAPVVFEDDALEGTWRPKNYGGSFHGPTRLREALYKSQNMVSIRVLRSTGVGYTADFASKFGFDGNELPRDLSLALGSCEVNPVQMARAFSVFANGGYLVQPYLIDRIEGADGAVLFKADPESACVSCEIKSQKENEYIKPVDGELDEEVIADLPKQAPQTLEPRLAYQMDSILRDVVSRGTGRRALALGRGDLAGKTGTTNDQKDAWFNGYHPDLVASVWVGFDQIKPLGDSEAGSKAALPIWIDFMKVALAGVPEKQLSRPEGLVTVQINAKTGELADDRDKTAVFEIFRSENVPVPGQNKSSPVLDNADADNPIPEQLF